MNQLIEVQARNGATTSYQYDEVGNRLTKSTVESSITTVETYTYDLANKLTSWTNYTYDQRGNLLEVSGIAPEAGLASLQDALMLDENSIENLIAEPEQVVEEEQEVETVEETVLEDASEVNAFEANADNALQERMANDAESTIQESESIAAESNTEAGIVLDGEQVESTEELKGIDEGNVESVYGIEDIDREQTESTDGIEHDGIDQSEANDGLEGGLVEEDSVIASNLLSATPGVLEQYEWSADNRLVRQVNERGGTTTYQYDGDGNRIYMGTLVGSRDGANQYPSSYLEGLRDGWEPQYKQEQRELYFANDVTLPYVEPLMASSANEQWSQRYVYGAQHEHLSMNYIVSGDASNDWEPTPGASGANLGAAYTDLYYLADVRGSVIGLTNDAGTISARYHYDEFGSMKDSYKLDLNYAGPDNLFGYTGLAYDYASDLSYARARYFDSGVGRFISEDTYEGQINDPLSLNLYTYVLNNPLIYTDPSGHKVWLVHGTNLNGRDDPEETWISDRDNMLPYLEGWFKESVITFSWTGGNSLNARQKAADVLVQEILDWRSFKGNEKQPIRLVGHSHGGNVAILAINQLSELGIEVDTLITIATPVREYQLTTDVGQHLHVYNNYDLIQRNGGSIKKSMKARTPTFENAINIEVILPEYRQKLWKNLYGVENHSIMHNSIDIWEEYILSQIKK